jgi:hypothetical protein
MVPLKIGLLKSKLEKFADNVTTKLADLAHELNSIKENRLYSIVVLETSLKSLRKRKLIYAKPMMNSESIILV